MESVSLIESRVVEEQPLHTTQVVLPEIPTASGMQVRLGMHTDSIQTLLLAS